MLSNINGVAANRARTSDEAFGEGGARPPKDQRTVSKGAGEGNRARLQVEGGKAEGSDTPMSDKAKEGDVAAAESQQMTELDSARREIERLRRELEKERLSSCVAQWGGLEEGVKRVELYGEFEEAYHKGPAAVEEVLNKHQGLRSIIAAVAVRSA